MKAIKACTALIGYVDLKQNSAGVLEVDYRPDINSIFNITVRIPAVQGGRVAVSGSGDITQTDGTPTGNSFDVRVNGSGDISLSEQTETVIVNWQTTLRTICHDSFFGGVLPIYVTI